MPREILWCHICRTFVESCNCSENIRKNIYGMTKRRSYKYISKQYEGLVNKIVSSPCEGTKQDNLPIWIFWWQGESSAPPIIKRCIRSIRKSSGDHPVYIIDSQNYDKFIHIPKHIWDKHLKNKISITHMSDYYRMALLAEYGGLWIDASVFSKKEINEDIFEHPLFTVRNPGQDSINISEWNWTVGVLGGWKGNTLFCAVRDLLSIYWENYDYLIDYFVFDYMVKLVYENCSLVKKLISEIEPNNKNFYFWQNNANAPINEQLYKEEISSSTWLYKLSWKGSYSLKTEDGENTFYSRLLKDLEN